MPRDDDESPDPRHVRSAPGSVLLLALLGADLIAVVLLAGGGYYVLRSQARKAELAAREAAEVARMEAEQAHAEAVRTEEQVGQGIQGPAAQLLDGAQLDPIPVDLATVSVEQAARLSGHLVLVTFDLLDNDDRRGAFIVYSNDGPDSDEDGGVERSVWVPSARREALKGRAVGTLAVIRHAAAVGADGIACPAWVEMRAVLDP